MKKTVKTKMQRTVYKNKKNKVFFSKAYGQNIQEYGAKNGILTKI
jgi:hypothetical protein